MSLASSLRRAGAQASGLVRRLRPTRFYGAPADLRAAYERDGFAAGGELLSPTQVRTLRNDFDRLFATARVDEARRSDGAGGEYYCLYNLHRDSPAVAAVATHPRLVALLQRVTGCRRMRLLLDQVQFKPPLTGGWNGWHRDLPSFPFRSPYVGITAWIPLDDATEANGCLRFVCGSQRFGDARDLAGDDWGLPSPLPASYRGFKIEEVARPVRAGHVHFHHPLTWHCSAPNHTRGPRRALALIYVDADARYSPDPHNTYPTLRDGDPIDSVAPIVVAATASASRPNVR